MKNVLATIVGFVVASATVYVFETLIGHNLFPLPEGAEPLNMEWLKNNMDKIPIGSKAFVVIGHFMGPILGMYIAALISKTSMIPSYIVGGIMLLATASNIIILPKELWFSIADGVCTIIAFLIGKSLAQKQIRNNT